MKTTRPNQGSLTQRLLVYCFTALFGLLVFWLLGFVLRDIGNWPGPNFAEVENRLGDSVAKNEEAALGVQIEETTREIESRRRRQGVLRDSTSNSEKTMNQLLELQKMTLQKGGTTSAAESQALAESQRLFLANQAKYQQINEEISVLSEDLASQQSRRRVAQGKIEATRPAIQKEFQRLFQRHQVKIAAGQLGVLLPLLGVAVWFFLKKRGMLYSPLIYGFGVAVLVKVGLVMHEHFPARFFKYVLIIASLIVVTRILTHLLRSLAFPKLESLIKQYREAYEHFLCPRCEHPIRRGALKYQFWTRRSLKKLRIPDNGGAAPDEPYICPVCATALFEDCPNCKRIRHSLLPACCHCGDSKSLLPEAAR